MINNSNFLIGEIPQIHPRSLEYLEYWKLHKRRCIEGYWVSGKWMPGPLYFYINFWHILLNKNKFSKVKSLGKPFLRDLEWDKSYVYMEAKGFSGFEEDEVFTCNRVVEEIENKYKNEKKSIIPDDEPLLAELGPNCFDVNGKLKKYVSARYYLRQIHLKNLGKPLFENTAKNVIDIECRGSGKSYIAAGMMSGHNFLFDGATDYDEYLAAIKEGKLMTSETLVGAINSFYSTALLKKVQTGINNLEGGILIGEDYYPSPFSKTFEGSWAAGAKNPITAKYYEYQGSTKMEKGSKSVIWHKTFKDNPTAANGLRPGLTILEEVGFMGNVQEVMGALKECTADGAYKFGVVYAFGTGGDMEGGTTQAVQEMFFEPEQWDALIFEDQWEGKKGIGYFVPYTMGLNQFKDSEGNTDFPKAEKFIADKRKKLASGSSKKPLNDELQNNPIKPSEAFLVTSGNVFPIGELREQLGKIEANFTTNPVYRGDKGTIVLDSTATQGVKFINDVNNELEVAPFPVKKGQDAPGCIHIWEHPPTGQIPYGMYIAGTDPYDQDQAEHTTSLGSTFIYKIGDIRDGGLDEMIVAEYTGRPGTVKEHHENVRKLLMYYNALDLYENERNTLKMHFEHKNSIYLLAETPDVLKNSVHSNVNRGKGIHMTKFIKEELELYARDWLLETAGKTEEDKPILNLEKIFSIGLLKELIAYNETGNFDRVIAFMLCICNRLQHHHVKVTKVKEEISYESFFNEKLFK